MENKCEKCERPKTTSAGHAGHCLKEGDLSCLNTIIEQRDALRLRNEQLEEDAKFGSLIRALPEDSIVIKASKSLYDKKFVVRHVNQFADGNTIDELTASAITSRLMGN